ncbi:hypothetical protein [Streptomyces sp. NPDC058667]|uniref:hypothetical protein n=1 Tax=Streptomyces sp. NPDC058667 TaxID=3346588 RepID=UPI003648769F
MSSSLPFGDTTDFDDADRGFLGALVPAVVRDAEARTVWDNDPYGFVEAGCPQTVNPRLWRQAQLASKQGLYEVTEAVYQVRGLDLSNITFVEGERGVVVIDPLISAETATGPGVGPCPAASSSCGVGAGRQRRRRFAACRVVQDPR